MNEDLSARLVACERVLSTPVAARRLEACAEHWQVSIERVRETPTSLIAFGSRADETVVLKVARAAGDEWDAGAIAAAFEGRGVVRVLEHAPGAVLLEQLSPGTPLAELVAAGNDAEAVGILAEVIRAMSTTTPATSGINAVAEWGNGFKRYLASGDRQIERALVLDAGERYVRLCRTQQDARLLHGDLQHYNVLFDARRGWTAIDPKGVVAEIEYELGAALRNPHENPALYSKAVVVLRRVEDFATRLEIDSARAIEWAYAQAVLSAIWVIEDEGALRADEPSLRLAAATRELLP